MFRKSYSAYSIVLLLIACSYVNAQKTTYEKGVKIVENGSDGAWGKNPQIQLIYEGKFGNHNEKDKNTMFMEPADIAFDKDENIYVLDAGECVIKKFDKNKKYLLSFGRKGKGPGEMIYPVNMDIDQKGNIYVYDFENMRLNIYSPQGKSTGTVLLKNSNYDFSVLNNGNFLLRNPNLDGGRNLQKNNVPLFFITNQKGDKLKEFGQGIYFTEKNYNGGNRLSYAVDKELNTYAAFLFQNRIDKYDKEGKLVLKIKRRLPSDRKMEGKDMYSLLNRGIAVDAKGRIWLAATRRDEKPEERVYTEMYSGPNKPLVVKRVGKGLSVFNTDMFVIELFDKEGKLLYKFPINHFANSIRLFKNKLYVIENDREMTFHVYKISDL